MTENLVQGSMSFLALACLMGLFFSAWQSLVVDAVRQRVFEIRDRAFLWAYDNGACNDVEYKEFRNIINITIRHYEHTSILKVFVLNKLFNLTEKAKEKEFSFLRNAHWKKEFHEATKIVALGLVFRSPLAMLLLILLLPVVLLSFILNNNLKSARVAKSLSREVEADILFSSAI